MLPVRKFILNTKVCWARGVQPERVQKCVAEGETESSPRQLEATVCCSVDSTKAGVHPDTNHTDGAFSVKLWLDSTVEKHNRGWRHESDHERSTHPSHVQWAGFVPGTVSPRYTQHLPAFRSISPTARGWDQVMPTSCTQHGQGCSWLHHLL